MIIIGVKVNCIFFVQLLAMQVLRGTEGSSYSFLALALDGVFGQCHSLAALYPQKRTTSTHWIGGWVDLRSGLDNRLPGIEL
jgi:hypothetical protein